MPEQAILVKSAVIEDETKSPTSGGLGAQGVGQITLVATVPQAIVIAADQLQAMDGAQLVLDGPADMFVQSIFLNGTPLPGVTPGRPISANVADLDVLNAPGLWLGDIKGPSLEIMLISVAGGVATANLIERGRRVRRARGSIAKR